MIESQLEQCETAREQKVLSREEFDRISYRAGKKLLGTYCIWFYRSNPFTYRKHDPDP